MNVHLISFKLLSLAVMLLGAVAAHGASMSTVFIYQGRLAENGVPANDIYDLEFRLFDLASLGTQQAGTVTVNDLAVTNGLFTVALDFGGAVFDGNPRWLNIAVRPGASSGSFTNLVPRQSITATPYAMTAGNLSGPLAGANLSGTYANALTLNNAANSFAGNGAGLTSLNAANLTGTISTPGKVANTATTATSANTANAIVARDGTGYFSVSGLHWSASELSADQGGSIELGNSLSNAAVPFIDFHYGVTTNQDYNVRLINNADRQLTVEGGFRVSGSLAVDQSDRNNGNLSSNSLTFGSPSGEGIASRRTAGPTQWGLDFYTAYQPRLTILNNGNIGIGLTNPIQRLQVGGGLLVSGTVTGDRFTGNGASLSNVNAITLAGIGSNGFWRINGNGGTSAGVDFLGTTDDRALEFKVNGSRALRLEPRGASAASLVGGYFQNSVGAFYGAAIAGGGTSGSINEVLGNYAFVGAGHGASAGPFSAVVSGGYNKALGQFSFLGSGLQNTNQADYSFLGGGMNNLALASADHAFIGGGHNNTANNTHATIAGGEANVASSWSTVGGGRGNQSEAAYATVAGGRGNRVAGTYATAGGGYVNTSSGEYATVGGGGLSTSSGKFATVAGGGENVSSGEAATVSGGYGNASIGEAATIVGGIRNTNSGGAATIGGGYSNTSSGEAATVGGGYSNVSAGAVSSIGGGSNNVVQRNAIAATIAGGRSNLIQSNSIDATIAGGQQNIIGTTAGAATIGGGLLNSISNDAGSATIAGGSDNHIQSNSIYAVIAGGVHNSIFGDAPFSSIGGGSYNVVTSTNGTVGGGLGNESTGIAATVGGGGFNIASGDGATVGGGGVLLPPIFSPNRAAGLSSTVAGGYGNYATNTASTVAGGANNLAGGQFSVAAGQSAKAVHDGSFVWADSQNADFISTANDQFNIRAAGGVRLNNDTSIFFGNQTRQMLNLWGTSYGIGVQGATEYFRSASDFSWFKGGAHNDAQNNPGVGGTELMRLDSLGNLRTLTGTISSLSDRDQKMNFEPIRARDVLEKVAALPLSRWSYKNDANSRHLGPMAQDFHTAFGIGLDDKSICTVDADGVALAAIQGLNQKVEEQGAILRDKDTQITALNRTVAELKEAVSKLVGQQIGGGQ